LLDVLLPVADITAKVFPTSLPFPKGVTHFPAPHPHPPLSFSHLFPMQMKLRSQQRWVVASNETKDEGNMQAAQMPKGGPNVVLLVVCLRVATVNL